MSGLLTGIGTGIAAFGFFAGCWLLGGGLTEAIQAWRERE